MEEGKEETGEIRRISGDGLSLKLRSNERILEIIGDGCNVRMTMNHGSVRIIGDACRLRIDRNLGEVRYTGDGGHVLLGPNSMHDRVKYIGDGGRVRYGKDFATENRKSKQQHRPEEESSRRLREEGKGCCARGKNGPGEEETEREFSERRETKRTEWRCGEEEKEKKLAGNRIVTTLQFNERIAKKWFLEPVTSSPNSGCTFVKIQSGRNGTKILVK